MEGTARGDVERATARLPERQREALELREHGLSYEEIAAALGTSRDAVGQLIAHGRINLYDELHGTILASFTPSPECERALGLIAAREDGELGPGSPEASRLEAHLEGCERCRRGVEEMRAAATEPSGAEEEEAVTAAGASAPSSIRRGRLPRRRTATVACLAALLGLTGLAVALVGSDPPPTTAKPASATPKATATGTADRGAAKPTKQAAKRKRARQKDQGGGAAPIDEATEASQPSGESSTPTSTSIESAPAPGAGPTPGQVRPSPEPSRPSAGSPVDSAPRPAASKPKPSPVPPPSTASDTGSASPPTPTEPPATEPAPVGEPVDEPPRRREPPGKPADRPPK